MPAKTLNVVQRRLQVLQAPEVLDMSVAAVCRHYGISRETFYAWRARYHDVGVAGLVDRSSRPSSSPWRTGPALEQRIVHMRMAHKRWGAKRIYQQLKRAGVDPPAVSTINTILRRNGMLTARPPKPPATEKRFERDHPNELWQSDGIEYLLASSRKVHVINFIDDHSRLLLDAYASRTFGCADTIAAFDRSIACYAAPWQLLTDNGSAYTGRPHDAVVAFERHVWRHAVDLIHGRIRHPQTQGKTERFQKTEREWLDDNGPYQTLEQLQAELDRFRVDYNTQRPHQAFGLDPVTPQERYDAGTPLIANTPPPTYDTTRLVTENGKVHWSEWKISIGRRWAGHIVTVSEHADKLRISLADQHIATVSLNHPKGAISLRVDTPHNDAPEPDQRLG